MLAFRYFKIFKIVTDFRRKNVPAFGNPSLTYCTRRYQEGWVYGALYHNGLQIFSTEATLAGEPYSEREIYVFWFYTLEEDYTTAMTIKADRDTDAFGEWYHSDPEGFYWRV